MFREAAGRETPRILQRILRDIWVKVDIADDRKKGYKLPKKGDIGDCKYSTRTYF